MSNVQEIWVYNDIETTQGTMSGDSMAFSFRLPDLIVSVPSISIKPREGKVMLAKEKKVNTVYNETIFGLIIFALFSAYCLASGKIIGRTGSVMLLILAISGLIAFCSDKSNWRRQSGR